MMIFDILVRYSLRKNTSSSGVSFSLIPVKFFISEKNTTTSFFSPSKFIFPSPDKISDAISHPTYSLSASLSFVFHLLSTKYFIRLEIVTESIIPKIISAGWLMIRLVNISTEKGIKTKKIPMRSMLLKVETIWDLLRLK